MSSPTEHLRRDASGRCVGACALLLVAWMASGSLHATGLPLQVIHRIALPGAAPVTGIDFDASGAQAYVATGATVAAFDVASMRQTSTLPLPAAAAALAIDKQDGKGYAAIAAPAELVVFQLHPLRIESTIPMHDGAPSALLYAPSERALYVLSRAHSSIARWDVASDKRTGQVRLPGELGQMASNARGTLYVANAADNTIDVVDGHSMNSLGAIPASDCVGPTGLAMDPVGRRLFVSCRDGARTVIDTDLGFTFESFPAAKPGPTQMIFAMHPFGPNGWKGAAFSAGENDVLAALRMNAFINYSNGGTRALDGRCQAMALDVSAGQLWLAIARSSSAASNASIAARSVELQVLTPKEGAIP